MELSLLYRGPLSSCNYGCAYCPFAKHEESREELAVDREALSRFLGWIEARPAGDRLSVFFTPWGEALIRPWYQDALARLSRLPQVQRAAIQTNLSGRTDFLDGEPTKIGIWATYHPEWAERARFVEKCLRLHAAGASLSAGVVGFPRFRDEIAALRRELPPDVYLWINAVKELAPRYTADELAFFRAVDPLFGYNLRAHASRGHACLTGERVISVDGEGTVRRCHFVRAPLGNLYRDDVAALLAPRACTNDSCGCHIGYVHMPELGLYEVFGEGVLERAPAPARTLPACASPSSGAPASSAPRS